MKPNLSVTITFAPKEDPGPSLIYLVGRSYFGPPYQYMCRNPSTSIALKQFNFLPPNTLF